LKKFSWIFIVTFSALQVFAQKTTFSIKSSSIGKFDFQEITIKTQLKSTINPFMDVIAKAKFINGVDTIVVDGFCDAQDGSIFKIRYMMQQIGMYEYEASIEINKKTINSSGKFEVISSNNQGPIQVDPDFPTHMQYPGSKKHYFWNSTTAYWMLGWQNDTVITSSIDRFAKYGINRIRVAINGRAHGGNRWNENTVVECEDFTFKLNPWVAKYPYELDNPEFDVTRFNIAHWQKMDRLIEHARLKGITVSFIFYVDGLDHGCDPFKRANMGNADEQRYYAYAAARYSGYENVMWDIANEYHLFRSVEWAEKMGSFLKQKDTGKHMISIHGSADFPFRKSSWVDCILYQSWDECGGYDYMTQCQKLQNETGRPLPSINEEYGYEGHYSVWGCEAVATKAKNFREGKYRSQLAWEMCMTGSYQTTGETAEYGTGAGENTGGGWINGRGNEKMTMLNYYKIMKDVFDQVPFWKMKPDFKIS
jgi:hypothetical protein